MLTTVRRDILDHSISGNKIFGGIINYIDGLHTTDINVPQGAAAPSAGTGLIDGVGVLIGSRSKIGNVQSNIVGAHNTLALMRAAAPTQPSFIAQESGTGARVLIKRSVAGGAIRIQLHAGNQSYFLDKLMVGRDTEAYAGQKFEATSGVIDDLVWLSAQGQSSSIDSIITRDSLSDQVALVDIIDMVYNLNDVIINGNELKEPFKTLSAMSAEQAEQLCTIIPSDEAEILEGNWAVLPSLNQDLGTTDTPLFEGIRIGDDPPLESSNILTVYREWINKAGVMYWGGVSCDVTINVVKVGNLVTITVRQRSPNIAIVFNNSGAITANYITMDMSDDVYNSIFPSLGDVSEQLIRYNVLTGGGVVESRGIVYCVGPTLSNHTMMIYDLINSYGLITIPGGKKITIPQFSLSYAIDR